MSSAIRSTGVQTTTRSADFTPSGSSGEKESIAPSSTARERIADSDPRPRRARPPAGLRREPTDPPMSPTPTMVIESKSMRGL